MGLDRDELAARFAVALACGDIASDQPERAPVDVVAFRAFEYADAFLAESSKSSTPALSPPAAVAPTTPAPVAPPAGSGGPLAGFWWLAEVPDQSHRYVKDFGGGVEGMYTTDALSARRWNTKAECAEWCASANEWLPFKVEPREHGFMAPPAAGLAVPPPAPTPAPEAKRPTCGACGCQDKLHDAGPFNARRCNQPGCGCEDFAPTPPAPSRDDALKACVDALVDVRDRLSVSQRLDLRPTIDAALALARAATTGGA